MKILGITGGIGIGKSKVLSYLEKEHHATVRQLDQVAMLLQKKGASCYRQIVEVFGAEILLADGELNRAKVAQMIFENSAKRRMLNQIVHPKVKEWIREDIEKERACGTLLYVIEAALLIEDNYKEICDEIWFIYSEKSVRMRRLEESRGYSKDKIEQIISAQLTDEEFLENTHRVIDNSGDFLNTIEQVKNALLLNNLGGFVVK